MQRLKILTVLILITCIVVGCGQPGPLYLPDKPATEAGSASEPDTDEDENKKKEGE
jgi:predicted small lipoprotein YifL